MGMSLHPLAERFASVAGAYERGRPGYGSAVTDALAAELRLAPGARVLDLAAGTGKLTRALLAAGLDVIAVEPHAALREVLAEHVGAERVLDGRAEQIPLAERTVAAVTVADAFHWFDPVAALAEICRVLVPGGGLAVLASVPDWRGASWAHELGSLMFARRPEHPHFDGPPWQDAVRAAGGWSEPRELRVSAAHPIRPAQIVDYVASMSWVAAMSEQEQAELLARVTALVEAGETPAEMPVHVVLGLSRLT
jgi:SAM-dependent methyltransferase